MKKTVKSLIVAASVAAIAGIGAVSFAKWDTSLPQNGTTTGSAGTIVTDAGNIVVNPAAATATLVPYDQVNQIGDNVKIHTFTVSYNQGSGAPVADYTFSMSLSSTLTLYYKIGASVTAPANADALSSDQWTEFDSSVTLDLASGTQTVNLILVSDDADSDMGQDYTVTISAALKTA